MAKCARYDDTCRGQFAGLHEKLDRLDESIRGNGKPGLTVRLDRLERSESSRRRMMWIVIGTVATLAVTAGWKALVG